MQISIHIYKCNIFVYIYIYNICIYIYMYIHNTCIHTYIYIYNINRWYIYIYKYIYIYIYIYIRITNYNKFFFFRYCWENVRKNMSWNLPWNIKCIKTWEYITKGYFTPKRFYQLILISFLPSYTKLYFHFCSL